MGIRDHLGLEVAREEILDLSCQLNEFRGGQRQFLPLLEKIVRGKVGVFVDAGAAGFHVGGQLAVFGPFMDTFGNVVVFSRAEDLAPQVELGLEKKKATCLVAF